MVVRKVAKLHPAVAWVPKVYKLHSGVYGTRLWGCCQLLPSFLVAWVLDDKSCWRQYDRFVALAEMAFLNLSLHPHITLIIEILITLTC